MNILIYGLEKSGLGSLDLLNKKKNNIFLYDDDFIKVEKIKQLIGIKNNIFYIKTLTNDLIDNLNMIVISPSISIKNKYVLYAINKNIQVVSELELAYRFCKNKIISVTGTNGKTTTVELIYNILHKAKKNVEKVGNIGYPLSKAINEKKKGIYVCEVSSFQLEAIKEYSSYISCLLNISPDHLNRHTYEEYTSLKYKIFDKCKYSIINKSLKKDNLKNCFIILNNLDKNNKDSIENGCFIKDNYIYFKFNKKIEKIIHLKDISLIGEHNIENVCCAIIVSKLLKIKKKYIVDGIKDFKPDEHRLQLVYKKNGINFYDDSKATNIDATIKAINSIEGQTMLILGGSDKGYDYNFLLQNLTNNIVKIFLIGEVALKIKQEYDSLCINIPIEIHKNLYLAVNSACEQLKSGQNLLLSPASASFDEFKNYKDRGEKFLFYIREFYEI